MPFFYWLILFSYWFVLSLILRCFLDIMGLTFCFCGYCYYFLQFAVLSLYDIFLSLFFFNCIELLFPPLATHLSGVWVCICLAFGFWVIKVSVMPRLFKNSDFSSTFIVSKLFIPPIYLAVRTGGEILILFFSVISYYRTFIK